MYLHHTGRVFRYLFPRLIWKKAVQEKVIYLTFDDGPIPEITEFVLDELAKYDAKATFFCVGDNIRKYPHIFQKLLDAKHSIGNHTFNHFDGWKTENDEYLSNIQKCAETIEANISAKNQRRKKLFRPPYGRLKRAQATGLLPDYQLIMWDVLSGDFDKELDPKICLRKSVQHTKKGSIIVFHDSIKASRNMMYVLPRYLKFFARKGFRFESL